MDAFRDHLDRTGQRQARKIANWRQRLLDLLEARVIDKIIARGLGERGLESLAAEIAARKKDPYAVVGELLARAGIR